jgi:hypothetical protein
VGTVRERRETPEPEKSSNDPGTAQEIPNPVFLLELRGRVERRKKLNPQISQIDADY